MKLTELLKQKENEFNQMRIGRKKSAIYGQCSFEGFEGLMEVVPMFKSFSCFETMTVKVS